MKYRIPMQKGGFDDKTKRVKRLILESETFGDEQILTDLASIFTHGGEILLTPEGEKPKRYKLLEQE